MPARSRLLVVALVVVVPLAAAACGCRLFRRELPADFRRGGLELDYVVATAPTTAGREAALAAASAGPVTARITALGACRPTVHAVGREVRVRLPAACGPAAARIKRLLRLGGRLEFREVDDGEALAAQATRLPPGLRLSVDRWHGAGARGAGQARVVEGPRAALEAFRTTLAPASAPALPADLEALLETPAESGRDARLYLVRRAAEVTGAHLRDAQVKVDEHSGRPTINVAFTAAGAEAFHRLTARLVGRKLAIVLDGRITSAPVVMTPIAGGRAMITLGGAGDPRAQEGEAEDLALALRAGALPAPLELARETTIAPGP